MKRYIPDESELPYKSDAFKDALYGFIENRIAIRKPLATKRAWELLYNKCKSVSEKSAIEALDKAVENNWTSIYPKEEPKQTYGFI